MKRLLTIVILFSLYGNGFAQSISFTLYGSRSSDCDVEKIKAFGLEKNGIVYSVRDSLGVLNLEQPGIYHLSYVLADIDTTQLGKEYTLSLNEVAQDTIKLKSIYECLEPTTRPSFSGYCCCDGKCDGRQIDFYVNGNKRIEGDFENGKPTGKLTVFYPGGEVMQIKRYGRNGNLKKVLYYNKSGRRIRRKDAGSQFE